MIKFNVLTLFPNLFGESLNNLPFKKAICLNELQVNLYNFRDFAVDGHGTVDSRVYGGGTGMLLRIEPIEQQLKAIKSKEGTNGHVVVLSPKGTRFTQKKAIEFSKKKQITLICGRYEGIDHRVTQYLADEEISIGDYVLSGGELAALIVMESVTRLLPGVLEKPDATAIESFSGNFLEFPQYTRPDSYNGMPVPEVLLSGNHKEIEKWRKDNSKKVVE